MSMDGINLNGPSFGRQSGLTGNVPASAATGATAPTGLDAAMLAGAFGAVPPALQNASNADKFAQAWRDKFMIWGAREGASEAGIKAVGNMPTRLARIAQSLQQKGFEPEIAQRLAGVSHMPEVRTYGQLFHLGGDKNQPAHLRPAQATTVSPRDWGNYKANVKANFSETGRRLSQTFRGEGKFFDTNAKGFLRQTVWEGNVQDVRKIKGAQTWGERMPGLSRLFGASLMGWDVLSSTKETHDIYKAQEDGSLGSKVKTKLMTAKTFVQKAAKDLVAWEVAGAGAAIGHAFALPGIAGLAVPIALGAAAATGVLMVLNKAIKEPEKPDTDAQALLQTPQARPNPFHTALS